LLEVDGITGFKNYRLEKLHVGGSIANAQLKLENTDIRLLQGASLTSNYAMIDFSDKEPVYDFDIATENFPITDFVPVFPSGSKVSVEAYLSGIGSSANSVTGSIHGTISGLMQNGDSVQNIELKATLDRDETPQHGRIDIITSS